MEIVTNDTYNSFSLSIIYYHSQKLPPDMTDHNASFVPSSTSPFKYILFVIVLH